MITAVLGNKYIVFCLILTSFSEKNKRTKNIEALWLHLGIYSVREELMMWDSLTGLKMY